MSPTLTWLPPPADLDFFFGSDLAISTVAVAPFDASAMSEPSLVNASTSLSIAASAGFSFAVPRSSTCLASCHGGCARCHHD